MKTHRLILLLAAANLAGVPGTDSLEGAYAALRDGLGPIIATLFAFSHLSFQYPVDLMAEGYSRLYDYAAEHPESAEIFQAID